MANYITKFSIGVLLISSLIFGCSKYEKNQSIKSEKDTNTNKASTENKTHANVSDSISANKDSVTIKELTFNDFAKTFMNEAFDSPTLLSKYSEDKITTTSIEGTNTTTPQKEFKDIKRFRKLYPKYLIKKAQIYIYGTIYEYDPKGTKEGMTLFFKEYSQAEKSSKIWKLYKIAYEAS